MTGSVNALADADAAWQEVPDHLIGAAAGDRNRLSDDTIRAALGAR